MKGRRVIIAFVSSVVCALTAFAQDAAPPNMQSVADTGSLDTKQFGLLAIQDNGRRKPIDTFAKETLTQITGRSSYTDKAGKKWTPNDFLLSVLLATAAMMGRCRNTIDKAPVLTCRPIWVGQQKDN